jgi:hypothetical protein
MVQGSESRSVGLASRRFVSRAEFSYMARSGAPKAGAPTTAGAARPLEKPSRTSAAGRVS